MANREHPRRSPSPTDTMISVSDRLEEAGFVVDAEVFRWYVDQQGGLDLTPGFYQLPTNDHMGNVLSRLRTPPDQTYLRVTFPEGFTIEQMGERLAEVSPRLEAEAFVAAAELPDIASLLRPPGVTSMEGLLFPDTYQVSNADNEAQVVLKMVGADGARGRAGGPDRPGERDRLSPYDILIIASMIEKEAKLDVDRPKIARVIYNRLFIGMNLQIDATLYYQGDRDTPFPVLRQTPGPYNTYLQPGPPADAHREPRPGVDPRRAQPGRQPAVGRPDLSGPRRPDPGVPVPVLRARRRTGRTRVRSHARAARGEHRGGPCRRGPPVTGPITGATRLAAVIGSPVRHSLSPALHNAAFEAAGVDWRFVAFDVAPGSATDASPRCAPSASAGSRSRCRTRPTWRLRSTRSTPAAAALQSVNTVVLRDDGTTFGASTDGQGFVDSLRSDGVDLDGRRVVVLGAGGAARSIVDALGRFRGRRHRARQPVRFFTAGESHGAALVVIVEGLPAGLEIQVEEVQGELARRRLGYGRGPRMRFEQDEVTLIGGVRHGRTLGSPVAIEIANTEWTRSDKWHEEMSPAPGDQGNPLTQVRPGHADLAGMQKYGFTDARDVLERASARETAARVAAGTLAKKLLSHLGVEIISHVIQMGGARAAPVGRPTPGRPGHRRRLRGPLLRPGGRARDGRRDQGGGQGRRQPRRCGRGARLRRARRPRQPRALGPQARRRCSPRRS
jgi:uncharacterized YceG family protein